jgi:hypothetical protein
MGVFGYPSSQPKFGSVSRAIACTGRAEPRPIAFRWSDTAKGFLLKGTPTPGKTDQFIFIFQKPSGPLIPQCFQMSEAPADQRNWYFNRA